MFEATPRKKESLATPIQIHHVPERGMCWDRTIPLTFPNEWNPSNWFSLSGLVRWLPGWLPGSPATYFAYDVITNGRYGYRRCCAADGPHCACVRVLLHHHHHHRSSLAALGLVENNAPNIVAAMLVSPLMGPVMSITFGTIIADRELVVSVQLQFPADLFRLTATWGNARESWGRT